MADTAMIPFFCPWCGASQQHGVHKGSVLEVICDGGLTGMVFGDVEEWCNKPIRLEIDKKGNLKSVTRITNNAKSQTNIHGANKTLVSINNVYGDVAVADNITTITTLYYDTVKAIDDAKNLNDEQKKQSKGILEHVKKHAPTWLPVIADFIKKTLGL